VIVLDTSVLVDCFTGTRHLAPRLHSIVQQGERILVPALTLYEWLRGPRLPEEIQNQEALFPGDTAILFGPAEARLSAKLYRAVHRARGREVDLAIAACAISHDAALWTANREDFADIPGLRLWH
jgi:predicted nucleic acid-binding protein